MSSAAEPEVSGRRGARPAWIEEMHEMLDNAPGQEVPLRVLSEHGMRFVPPGPAWREGMAKRKTDANYRGAETEAVRPMENLRVIRTGSKRIVLKAIHYECKAGRFEKFERNDRTWVRLVRGLH